MIMRRIWDATIINSITVITILAMITGFSMVSGCLKITVSAVDRVDELIEVVNYFLDKAAEPALLTKSDENRLTDLKTNFLRNFVLSEPAYDHSNFYFSHIKITMKNNFLDYNLPITIKLLI